MQNDQRRLYNSVIELQPWPRKICTQDPAYDIFWSYLTTMGSYHINVLEGKVVINYINYS